MTHRNERYGMHSAAGAIGTGLLTPGEETAFFYQLLSNPVHICSFSPFNTYFVLFGLGNIRPNANANNNKTAATAATSSLHPAPALQGALADPTSAMRAALGMIRRCFHGMNRLGATTYWETFSPEWNNLFHYGDPTPNSQTG